MKNKYKKNNWRLLLPILLCCLFLTSCAENVAHTGDQNQSSTSSQEQNSDGQGQISTSSQEQNPDGNDQSSTSNQEQDSGGNNQPLTGSQGQNPDVNDPSSASGQEQISGAQNPSSTGGGDQNPDGQVPSSTGNPDQPSDSQVIITLAEIPEYSGEPYIEINGNEPDFPETEWGVQSFEMYSELDGLGRCGAAYANVGTDLMPTEKRGDIGQVKPSGWQTVKYDCVDGNYLYNRCHLIGYQLSGENANEKNLITGTRYMNVEGMLPFENMVADYVKETGNHVLYRVTPFFDGNNLLANGVQMEAFSVEDEGDGICYNVYVYNVQPGIVIDYATGESALGESDVQERETSETEIRGNSNSKIYHCPGQASYEEMADSKYLVIFRTEQEAEAAGYRKAKR